MQIVHYICICFSASLHTVCIVIRAAKHSHICFVAIELLRNFHQGHAVFGLRSTPAMQEKPDGKVAELWQSKLDASGLSSTDVASGFAAVFAVKDKDEIQNIRRSGYLSATVLRSYAVPHLESGFLLP